MAVHQWHNYKVSLKFWSSLKIANIARLFAAPLGSRIYSVGAYQSLFYVLKHSNNLCLQPTWELHLQPACEYRSPLCSRHLLHQIQAGGRVLQLLSAAKEAGNTQCLLPGYITMVTMLITGAVAWSQYKGQFPVEWSPNAGGWIMHCISTALEWLMALRCEFDRSQFYLLSDGDE